MNSAEAADNPLVGAGGAPILRMPPNERPIRTAIVGTGYIADFHAQAIRQVPDVELICICDASSQSAHTFAAQWDVSEVFSSLEEMLQREKLECIHVLTPPDSHYA